MASQGPNTHSTISNDNSNGGIFDWVLTGNWSSSDDSWSLVIGGGWSKYAKMTNYGFSIPTGATIDGIEVEVERHSLADSGGDFGVDLSVRLVKGGTFTGDDKADTTTHWPTTDAYKTYGGATDLWGETWTAADINSTGFGFGFSGVNNSPTFNRLFGDHARITVYYTEGGGPTFQVRILD